MDLFPSFTSARDPSAAQPRSDVRLPKVTNGNGEPANTFLLLGQFPLFSGRMEEQEEEEGPPGVTDVGRLRGSLCFTIMAL